MHISNAFGLAVLPYRPFSFAAWEDMSTGLQSGNIYLKVHSCAQTWYLSILKCDSRVVVHSSIWTLCIPKCAYGAHKACFTLKHFDLGNHRNMYLHNTGASTDMTLWTCTYTYVRAHLIVKTWPNRELFETENIHVYFSFKGQYNINEYLHEKRDSGLKCKKVNWSTLIRTHADPKKNCWDYCG